MKPNLRNVLKAESTLFRAHYAFFPILILFLKYAMRSLYEKHFVYIYMDN